MSTYMASQGRLELIRQRALLAELERALAAFEAAPEPIREIELWSAISACGGDCPHPAFCPRGRR